ncbi:MAG: HAMP domain-containing protein [Desulfomonile tiedjei]|nr:HAMP domain-containing protein [Desulfomonile tiedjei]
MKKRSTLERKMLSYFGLIAAASLLITVEFIWAIREATPHPETVVQSSVSPSDAAQSLSRRMEALQSKAVLMCVVQAVVTLIVLIMFMRRITGPLQAMVEEAGFISDGDLSRTIQVRTQDEIGLIGETINGLTSNIQEIVGLGLSTEAALRFPLAELRERLDADEEAGRYLDEIEGSLDIFKDLAQGFKLLPPPMAAEDAEES